ncbi:MAG: chemotaxis protein CheX [Bacillota bacterium]
MDVRMYAPFVESFFEVLPDFGVKELKRGRLALKDKLVAAANVNVLVGLSQDVRGNVAYSMTEGTARNIASFVMGFPVGQLDEMAKSAVAELANVLASRAAIILERGGLLVSISPPTLIAGKNVTLLSHVRILAVEVFTGAGLIEANIGLET